MASEAKDAKIEIDEPVAPVQEGSGRPKRAAAKRARESLSASIAAAKQPLASDDDGESDDDSIGATPKKALRGKYSETLKALFHNVLDLVDVSNLPLFKSNVKKPKAALEDFVAWLFDATERDARSEDIESDIETDADSGDFADDLEGGSSDDGGEESIASEEGEGDDDDDESEAKSADYADE